jgi:ribulose-phosphate 3-epimerase
MKKTIIPAIIAKSQEELERSINRVKDYCSILQLDIMDGIFVPNHSLDFEFKLPWTSCKYEAHLMVNEPEAWIDKIWEKADTILVHIESCKDPLKLINQWKNKRKFGLVLNPETPIESIQDYLDQIEQILIMTVNPGFYGSEFLPVTLNKVKELRKRKPELDIEVDGGITPETIGKADQAGANLFVSGSYVVKSENVKEALESLKNKLERGV